MTHFKHLLTLLLAVTCLQMSARVLPNDDGTTPAITFMSGTTTLSDNQTVPNGTLIQLQAKNFPEDAAFSYLIGTQPATAKNFEQTKSDKDQNGFYLNGILGNAPLVYQHGIPVFASYTTASQPIVLSVQVSKPGTDKKGKAIYPQYDGYTTIYTLTLNIDGKTTTVAPPTIAPKTNTEDGQDKDPNTNTILTLSESSVTTGATGNTVFAKYSNSKKYTALQLMAEPNLQLGAHGAGTIGIFSTKTAPARRTTALQVQHNFPYGDNTYDVASDVTEAYYWYTTDRKKAVIKAYPDDITTTAEEIEKDNKTSKINVSFYDANDQSTPLTISNLIDYQTKNPVSYTYICNNPEIASVDKDGNVKFTGKAGRAYITIFTNKVNMFNTDTDGKITDNSTNIGYDGAVTTVSLTVTDPVQLMPPIILPDGKKYFKDLKVTVTVNTNDMTQKGDAYYVVVAKGTATPQPEDIVKNGTKVTIGDVGATTLSKRNATVYAVSYNRDLEKYSAISTETFEYVDLQDPVLTPGNKGGIYWFIGDENTKLPVVASTATPYASVYYTINQPGDINDISLSGVQLYSVNDKITVKSGDVVRAVTYLDGVYSNTVTYNYKNQDGGSWRSYSSTSNRVFRDGIQAYIITGYDKDKNAFIAKSIDVGATGKSYLPPKTGVLLYSATLTQAQLLNDGIDGKGISVHGSGGRTQTPDLTGNMLIAADADYQEHINTYDDKGNINMAFNRWKDCAKYDGNGDYYGFFSFYEDNTRKNKNNWRHTAYLQLPKGSKENIYFRDKEKEGETISAKITIVDDEPTAIQTVQQDADKADNAYYTLSGVQVAQPTAPGIYIHNGHKIIIKK